MRSTFTFTTLILTILMYAQNTEPLSLSLDEAIASALQNQVTLKNAQLDIDYANTQVSEVKAQGLPQVNGTGNFMHSFLVPTSIIPGEFAGGAPGSTIPVQFGVPFTATAGVGVQQLLFDGTFFLGLKAASEFVNISKLSLESSEIEVKEAVTKAYYMALISEQNIAQLSESLTNIENLKEETKKLYEEGFAEQLDVDRLVLSVSNLEINIAKLKSQAGLTKQLLLNTMGLEVTKSVILTSKLPAIDSTKTTELNAGNRVEMKLLDQQQRLNELTFKRYKMGYLPSLYGSFSYGANTFATENQFGDLGGEWFGNGSYGIALSVPIFDGFYKKAKMDQAKIDIRKTENTKQQLAQSVSLQINQAKTTYDNALKTLELQEKTKTLAERIYKTTQIKFKEGVGSSFEMINAESELTTAHTNYLNALYELNVAKIDLNKALGTL